MSRPASTFPVRGACPGVVAPMEAADGMLLRVRLPGGVITTGGLRTVADVAERLGSGVVELTVRANLQIRGVAPADVAATGDLLVQAGLALADPVRDERRDVIGSPLAGHDPTELVDLCGVLADVADRLATEPGLDGLPPKFGVVLDDGGTASVRTITADVALGAVRADDGRTVLQLELGRALDHGGPPSAWIEVTDVVPVVLAGAHLTATHGERMTTLVALIGRDAGIDAITAGALMAPPMLDSEFDAAPAGDATRAALITPVTAQVDPTGPDAVANTSTTAATLASLVGGALPGDGTWTALAGARSEPGQRPPTRLNRRSDDTTTVVPPARTDTAMVLPPTARPAPIGPSPHRDDDRVNVGAAPFLGRTSPAALRSVADLADAGGASIRLTPWRGLVLAGVPRSQRSTVIVALAAVGFSADPEDPAHLVSACVGRPGCASSKADTQAAARALLHQGGLTARIHLSGCDKRCGADAGRVVVADEDGEFRIGAR